MTLPVQVASANTVQADQKRPPALMLAQNWQSSLNPADFLVSEKLDGVRAYWDGEVLRFRSGRLIAAPAWFTAALPKTSLDGELWMGRGSFDRVSGATRKAVPIDAEWREVRYMVFDMPGAVGPFSLRAQRIASVIAAAQVPWLEAVTQQRLVDSAALHTQLKKLSSEGGEGLVLHRADARWEAGRSDALRKLKLQPDEEARVVALISGKGRHEGRMGALLVEMADGKRFALGTGFTDAQRADPPSVGDLVTYRYRDRTPSGLPKFASFLRVREAE
jgi:DNA ligase-1